MTIHPSWPLSPRVVLALLSLGACRLDTPPALPSGTDAEAALIRTRAQAWYQAIADQDLEKTLSFYATDAQYLSAGRPPAATAEDRRRLWVEDFATPGFSSDEATASIEVAGSGDLAYQRGTYVSGALNARGQPIKTSGKFVVVWKKQADGIWKAVIDIDNADQ